jgi:hypothetical protein
MISSIEWVGTSRWQLLIFISILGSPPVPPTINFKLNEFVITEVASMMSSNKSALDAPEEGEFK